MARPEFIAEPITVDVGSMDTSGGMRGAPTCPRRFTWRGQTYHVAQVIDEDKQLRAHDSAEKYVKSHSFRIRTTDGWEMVLRCDRQARGNAWRVFTVQRP